MSIIWDLAINLLLTKQIAAFVTSKAIYSMHAKVVFKQL